MSSLVRCDPVYNSERTRRERSNSPAASLLLPLFSLPLISLSSPCLPFFSVPFLLPPVGCPLSLAPLLSPSAAPPHTSAFPPPPYS
eukprot:scaffold184289_cov27-Tisochrysis_lutea.AAC.3